MPARGGTSADQNPLDSESRLAYQRRSWAIQRVGWVLMGLFLVLGILGLFGGGPLARAHAGSPGTLEVRYERVGRLQTEARVELTAPRDASGQVALRIDDALLDHADVRFPSPLPRRIEAVRGGQLIVFDAAGEGPVSLQMRVTPTRLGPLHTSVAASGSAPVPLSIFVLP